MEEVKNPTQAWFCKNAPCHTFLGLEKQTNVPCWHFCPACLQKNLCSDSEYRNRRIVPCSICSKKFCQDCTNFKLRDPKNTRCLICHRITPEKETLDDESNEEDNEDLQQRRWEAIYEYYASGEGEEA